MSWLARLEVDVEAFNNKGLSDDIYAWHRMLWECCPNVHGAKRDFLTRIDPLEGMYRLWIMAKRKPSRPRWCPPDGFALKEISPSFLTYRHYAFDLLANPTKCLVRRGADGEALLGPNGKRKHGKRIPLVNQEELRAWLVRKGRVRCLDEDTGLDVPGGFRLVDEKPLEISPMVQSHFRKGRRSGYHGGVRFRGILEVTDRRHFVDTYESGIGSAKSFGFGLLLIAPAKL